MNVASFRWLLIVVTKITYLVDANWITGNLCWSMPCMNGGSCFGSAYTYLCVCPVNYSGALCEKRLGACQASPCGNRGLCVETGLTSFECRCYFDYMGQLCEEHVPKNDPSVWSSLIPVHTRVLFDILQEAYRVKARGRSSSSSNNSEIDFVGLLTTDGAPSSSSPTTLSPTLESTFITRQSETTETEHVIKAENIQLDKIFPKINIESTSDMNTQSSIAQAFQTTQQNEYNNETAFTDSFETNMTSTYTSENITTTLLPLTAVENMTIMSLEQNQTNFLNITEDQETINITQPSNTILTSTSVQWSSYDSDNNSFPYTAEPMQNSTEQVNNNTDSEEFLFNTSSQTNDYTASEKTAYSSNQTDDDQFTSTEQTINSTLSTTDQLIDTANISQNAHSQLLYRLCQQLLSHILPNVSSLSSTSAVKAALSLASGSPSTGNNSADALLIWLKEQLSSSTITSTTTPSTTTSTSTLSSSSPVPSLLINERKLSSISLQRIDMDDALRQMNNNIDSENS